MFGTEVTYRLPKTEVTEYYDFRIRPIIIYRKIMSQIICSDLFQQQIWKIKLISLEKNIFPSIVKKYYVPFICQKIYHYYLITEKEKYFHIQTIWAKWANIWKKQADLIKN